MTREEYLERAKKRAFEYLDQGDGSSAVASILSDLGQREDTKPNNVLELLGMRLVLEFDEPGIRRFIEGFR